jgi:hypothetical protein
MYPEMSKEAVFEMTLSDIRSKLLKRGEVYSIIGWFSEDVFGEKYCAFGGRFLKKDNRIVEGSIIDRCGNSEITEGYIDSEILQFSKYYPNSKWNLKSTFNYKFKKENGIWIGEYDGQANDCRAKAVTVLGDYIEDSKKLDELLEITKF